MTWAKAHLMVVGGLILVKGHLMVLDEAEEM